jgi:hypothetical protein
LSGGLLSRGTIVLDPLFPIYKNMGKIEKAAKFGNKIKKEFYENLFF